MRQFGAQTREQGKMRSITYIRQADVDGIERYVTLVSRYWLTAYVIVTTVLNIATCHPTSHVINIK